MRMLGGLVVLLLCAGCASGTGRDGPPRRRDAGSSDAAAATDSGSNGDASAREDASLPTPDAGRDTGSPDLCASVDCTSLDGYCATGVCDPATGTCRAEPRPDGTRCDDEDACTTGDRCVGGACAAMAVDCSHLSDACNDGMCMAASGTCISLPVSGRACDDGDPCTTADACAAGVCTGMPGGCPGTLIPGRTDLVASMGGWSVRCLEWSGRTCTHGQTMMDCSICPMYPQCGVWHDVTTYNDGDQRCSGPFCAIATGNGTVNATGTGAATSVAPRACGWGAMDHPHCTALRATYHPAAGGVDPRYGLLLEEGYCFNETTLRTFDCAGW